MKCGEVLCFTAKLQLTLHITKMCFVFKRLFFENIYKLRTHGKDHHVGHMVRLKVQATDICVIFTVVIYYVIGLKINIGLMNTF